MLAVSLEHSAHVSGPSLGGKALPASMLLPIGCAGVPLALGCRYLLNTCSPRQVSYLPLAGGLVFPPPLPFVVRELVWPFARELDCPFADVALGRAACDIFVTFGLVAAGSVTGPGHLSM